MNITHINILPSRVWKPDVVLYDRFVSPVTTLTQIRIVHTSHPHQTSQQFVNKLHSTFEIWRFVYFIVSYIFRFSVSSSRSGGFLDVGITRIIVNSSGYHQWYSPVNLETHCKIDVRNFPFDQQACVVKLGSWTYDGYRLDINPEAPSADLGKIEQILMEKNNLFT